MKRIVNIADMAVSDNADDVLVTYALGPCLGVAVYDATAGVGGLLHCQLPSAKGDAERIARNPAQFVDSGLMAMLEAILDLGAVKQRLTVKVAGGAQVMNDLNGFQIAERNYTVLRKLLWKNDLLIAAEDVGGSQPRNMTLIMNDGAVRLHSCGKEWDLD